MEKVNSVEELQAGMVYKFRLRKKMTFNDWITKEIYNGKKTAELEFVGYNEDYIICKAQDGRNAVLNRRTISSVYRKE